MATIEYEQRTFDIPVELGERIDAVQAAVELFEWSPEQALNTEDLRYPEECPKCKKLASTIAQQLTYRQGEPPTLLFWCLSKHSWRWNSFEGRVLLETAP